MSKPCIFLDRDGVINKDYVDYVYSSEKLTILPGVAGAIRLLKDTGYTIVVITNQSGIAQEIYTRQQMHECHELIQKKCDHGIDHFYYSPWHPKVTESLTRKPGSLMFEKAIARFDVAVERSWMVGDKERDLVPAKKIGIRTIQVDHSDSTIADHKTKDLAEAVGIILSKG
ncbi:HAD-IIIA family hydrolase [Fulvivirga sp. M361]|uniref:D-glycero-alpha-D-manno-heptose-1,7-bisphosphate 7-phosphatase n=1 Tax=Fulvivirga sp. M361 TaxID=2594266 RepID=UPI001179BFCA|nr:HAD-IIIA family hydrolase [Fulvivirga sp. M361]TRX58220.1 HAD-IIIA family hydrolase [Fulvivirga sp. M361]